MKALLLENIHTEAEDILRRHGVEVETHEGGQPSWWWLLAAQ